MSNDESVQVTLDLPKQVVDDILFMLQPELGEMDHEKILTAFALLGLEHFYDWMSGRKRCRTLTEQYIIWLEDVYTRLLPPAEVPAYSRLYNRFNIPYGQAGYIIRVLNERELPHLRIRAVEELKRALEKARQTAEQAVGKARPEQPIAVNLSSLASRELCNLANSLYRRFPETLLPQRETGYGDVRTVMVPAKTLIEMLRELSANEE